MSCSPNKKSDCYETVPEATVIYIHVNGSLCRAIPLMEGALQFLLVAFKVNITPPPAVRLSFHALP